MVIDDRTDESSLTKANPDGSYTVELSSVPERVRTDSGWTPIDVSLVAHSDGTLRPRAGLADVAFSGGGTGPMAVISHRDTGLEWTWPGTLPAPTVSGDTATYADVLPGVDLRLTALPGGFTDVLVVKNRTAAQQSAIRNLAFGWKVKGGGSVSANAAGGFDVRNRFGERILGSAAPRMWDSSGAAQRSGTSTDQLAKVAVGEFGPVRPGHDRRRGPVEGDRAATMPITVSSAGISLAPVASVLTASDTVYPVYIDPDTTTRSAIHRAMVDKSFPNTSYYDWGDADQGVGYQNYSGTNTKRLMWTFETTAHLRAGTVIIKKAELQATEVWSAGCVAKPVSAYKVTSFNDKVTWNTAPVFDTDKRQSTLTVAYGNGNCSKSTGVGPDAALLEFPVEVGVQSAVDADHKTMTFGLKGPESDPLGWKRFTKTAKVVINYNHLPNKPYDESGPGGCQPSTAPGVVGAGDQVMRATITDPDTEDLMDGVLTLKKSGTVVKTLTLSNRKQGVFSFTVENLNTSGSYSWQVKSVDPDGKTALSDACYFTVDNTRPGTPAVHIKNSSGAWVSSGVSSDGTPIPMVVRAGIDYDFKFSPGGTASDTYRYRWALNQDTAQSGWLPSAIPATGGTVYGDGSDEPNRVRVSSYGPNLLRVWAYDKAGNASAAAELFLTSEPAEREYGAPVRWGLDDVAGPSRYDTTCLTDGSGQPPSNLTWVGAVSTAAGLKAMEVSTDRRLQFDGKSMAYSAGPAPSVSTYSSADVPNYSVMAWVHIPATGVLVEDGDLPTKLSAGSKVAFSIDGPSTARVSALSVGLGADQNGDAAFEAVLRGPGNPVRVVDTTLDGGVRPGAWYNVAAVVAPNSRVLQLLVTEWNAISDVPGWPLGVNQATGWTSSLVTYKPSGSFRLGSLYPTAAAPNTPVSGWVGGLDEARVYRGALPGAGSTPPADLVNWARYVPTLGRATQMCQLPTSPTP